MNRHGDLYERMMAIDNLKLADEIARKGKTAKFGVRLHDAHRDDNIERLHEQLERGDFKTSKYRLFTVFEPKMRVIHKLPYYPDRILQHAIMNVLEPIFVPTFTADTYACIKGRGLHKCADKLRHVLYIDTEGTKYCLKLDVKQYYPSIDHEILKRQVRRKIKDARMLALLDEIIDSGEGLPIGNYLSQYFANVYLCGMDHRLKEKYGVKYYFRYVDDMVFLAGTKEELHRILDLVRLELANLKLQLKDNWQIFPVDDRGIDFLGYKFFHGYTLLRKSVKKNIFRKVSAYNHDKMSKAKLDKSLASYHGWLKWCDSSHLSEKIHKTIKQTKNTIENESTLCKQAKRH